MKDIGARVGLLAGGVRERLRNEPAWRLLALLCVFVVACGMLLPNYLGARLLPDLCADAALPGIAAVGVVFVLACGSIDLSIGSLAACSSLVVASSVRAGAPPGLAILAGFASGVTSGLALGWLVRASRVPAFVASLGAMFALRASALAMAEESIAIDEARFAAWSGAALDLGGGRWRPAAGLFVLVVVAGHLLLSRWRAAREALAQGIEPEQARLHLAKAGGHHVDALAQHCLAVTGRRGRMPVRCCLTDAETDHCALDTCDQQRHDQRQYRQCTGELVSVQCYRFSATKTS